jgi:oxalate decarboxylase/phosphoglucose isomerase-like protein (cupin superfamily)
MPEESVARFVDPSEVETQVFDWGSIKWLSEPRVTGTERFTAGLVILEPGKGHTRHNHPGVEEILYVVSGEGEQMIEVSDDSGGMRPERQTVRAGQMVFIPADIYHETINTGWEPMRIIAIYAPPGPEAILRAMEGCTVLPPGQLPGKTQ